MTKRGLIDELVTLYPRFSRRDAEVMVNAVFESLADALRRGERDRDPRLRQLRGQAPRGARRAQPAHRQARRRRRQAGAVLQGRQGTAPARRRRHRRRRRGRGAELSAAVPPSLRRHGPTSPVGAVAHGVHRCAEDTRLHLLRGGDRRSPRRAWCSPSPITLVAMLNRYPYANAHVMLAPRVHTAEPRRRSSPPRARGAE